MKAKQRYEIRGQLGEGGMGVVYLAFDRQMKREVALKTIRDVRNSAQLDLFYKEWDLLKAITHPNIIEVFDVGALEDETERKPYFVMPLLKGVTLQELIRTSSRRLTIARAIDIISQACRGLQAAHDAGLIHRDVKPSNIFVLEDDSVKIIDFGVARVVDVLSEAGWKGTLAYMSPEQVQLKPVTPASDIFSLGIVAYEVFTRRRPFEGRTERDRIDAILNYIPPPVSTANPEVNDAVGRVVHKAMAKNPLHRFASARELADTLQKAFRGEPIEMFDRARIRPRIDRANRAFEEKDYQLAAEILRDLECEGHIDSDVSSLRMRVEQLVRQKKVQRLVDTARSRFEEREYLLALQKIDEALEVDPDHTDAIRLRRTVEAQRTEETIQDWFRLARQHIDNYSFDHAREAVENVLKLSSSDTQANRLLTEIQHKEQEHHRVRQEKEQLFRVAQETWQHGEVSSALGKLERLLELERAAPGHTASERGNAYLALYNEVRSEHDLIENAYAEGRRLVSDKNLTKARALCDEYIAKYPGNALFQALRFDVEELLRQERSAFIVDTDRRVEAEPDLDRRVAILEEAVKQCPGEVHFEHALGVAREKRDFVHSIVTRANRHEAQGQFGEAIDQWKILRSVYNVYPGLEFEIDRLSKRRDQQQRTQTKSRWVQQIDLNLETGEHRRALDLLQSALVEFPEDAELLQLRDLARQALDKAAEAQRLQAEAQQLTGQQDYERSASLLRRALELDTGNRTLRLLLADNLAEQARSVIENERESAERLIQQSLDLDPEQPKAKGLLTVVLDQKRDEYVEQCRVRIRQLQTSGELGRASEILDEALRRYPGEPHLDQLRTTLARVVTEDRARAVQRLRDLSTEAGGVTETAALSTIHSRAVEIARLYPGDRECGSLVRNIEQRLVPTQAVAQPSTPDANAETVVAESQRPEGESAPEAADTVRRLMEQAGGSAAGVFSKLGALLPGKKGDEAVQDAEKPVGTGSLHAALRRPAVWVPFAALLAAVGLFVAYRVMAGRGAAPSPAPVLDVDVIFTTDPPGANLSIDGETIGVSPGSFRLKAGSSHELKAELEGFKTGIVSFDIPADGRPVGPIVATLEPEAPNLILTADLDGVAASLDDEEPLSLEDGQRVWTLTPKTHTLRFKAGGTEFQAEFDSPVLALPALTGKLPGVRGATIVAICSYRDSAAIYASSGLKIALFGDDPESPVGPADAEGAEAARFTNLRTGSYTVKVGEGDSERVLELKIAAVPQLAISIIARATATLRILTLTSSKEPLSGVKLYLNDKEWRSPTRGGRLVIANLPPGDYRIRASAVPGYDSPPERSVSLGKGQSVPLTLVFPSARSAASADATLMFDATQEHVGAMVSVGDDAPVRVEKTGPFSLTVRASDRERPITIQKDHFRYNSVSKKFNAGTTVTLTPDEARLIPTWGRVLPSLQPANVNATLSYRVVGSGGPFIEVGRNRQFELPQGDYEFSGVAAGYEVAHASVSVRPGQTSEVVLSFRPEASTFGIQEFEQPGRWRLDQQWRVRKGEDFVKFRPVPATGRFSFDWLKQSGGLFGVGKGKVLRWALGFVDEKNYVAFEFDGEKLVRSIVIDGKERDKQQVGRKIAGNVGAIFRLSITVESSVITSVVEADKKEILVDSWAIQGHNMSKGLFAYRLPRGEEVWISNFEFQQRK